ncbi:MAG: hypothetical protein ACOYNF_19285 [Rhodoferax sp.]
MPSRKLPPTRHHNTLNCASNAPPGTGLAGKAHLKLGNVASALPQLGRAVALAQMHLDAERSPRLADALLALADASLQAGQDDAARAALARAQHILASHAAPVPTLFDTIRSPLPVTT